MENVPSWLTNALTSVIVGVFTFLLSRRYYGATVSEKEASALITMTKVAADLARQLEAFTNEIPAWRQKIAAETARADKAEKENICAVIIQKEAKTIVEEISHLSYYKGPDEEETTVERRFRNMKTAAQRIAACIEENT